MTKKLDNLISFFVNSEDKGTNPEILNCAKSQLRKEVVSEIKEEVKDDIITEYENSMKKSKFNQVIVLLAETILLAFLVGLLTNQFTDLISSVKGSHINITATLWWILGIFIFLIIIFISIIYKQLTDLYNFFNKEN